VSVYTPREDWLVKVATLLLPSFQEIAGIKAYPKYRVSCGFPSTGRRGRRIGECWYPGSSKDAHHELFIHPTLDEPIEVAATLAHELAHVVAGPEAKHGKDFKRLVTPLGLTGRACATVAGEGFIELIKPILKQAGKYPHASLSAGGTSTRGPKQSTRMIKVVCEECGYILRTTRSWLQHGIPSCPNAGCDRQDRPMDIVV